jgi:dihydrofolate synthase/folylpolyglutamate synthase
VNFEDTLVWLYARLPMFQRSGPAQYKVDLNNTHALCKALGHPDQGLKVVHIAGTNGKGSVSHAVAAALQTRGMKVGLYTSPHLLDPRERIRIDGDMISKADFVSFVEGHLDIWEKLKPSFFELMFAMALVHFRDGQVDIAVLETGMGGRLDSTNIFPQPLATAITSIGLDHQQFLGEDLRSIAGEKAGILKEGVPCVLGVLPSVARSVVLERSLRLSVEVHDGRPDSTPSDDPVWLARNRSVARKLLDFLPGDGASDEEVLNAGPTAWGLMGRWQWFGDDVLLDCAHNEEGLLSTGKALFALGRPLRIVYGAVEDKDIKGALACLPQAVDHHWCAADIPRAMSAEVLSQKAEAVGRKGTAHPDVASAVRKAVQQRSSNELVVILGSIFIAGEAITSLQDSA